MKEPKLVFVATASVGMPVRPAWWTTLEEHLADRAVLFDTTMAIEKLDHPALSRPVTKRRIVRGLDILGLDVAANAPSEIPGQFLTSLVFDDVQVVRDAIVLARSSLVILDANHPSMGDNFVLAANARVLGLPVLVVSDRTVRNVWVSYLATAQVSSHMVGIVARQLLLPSRRRIVGDEMPANDAEIGR